MWKLSEIVVFAKNDKKTTSIFFQDYLIVILFFGIGLTIFNFHLK